MTLEDLLALPADEFVQAVFDRFLGRAPDDGGLRHYLDRLALGKTKSSVLLDIADSPEARNREVDAELQRLPDDRFVDTLYGTHFGRSPDAAARSLLLRRLKTGTSRAHVLVVIRASSSGRAHADDEEAFGLALDALRQRQREARKWWRRFGPWSALRRDLCVQEERINEVAGEARRCRAVLAAQLERMEQRLAGQPAGHRAGGASTYAGGGVTHPAHLSPDATRVHEALQVAIGVRSKAGT